MARRVGLAGDVHARDARLPEVIDSSVVSIFTVVDLPAPFGPEEAEHLALLDPQVDPAHRLDIAVVLDQSARLDGGRSCFRSDSWSYDRRSVPELIAAVFSESAVDEFAVARHP